MIIVMRKKVLPKIVVEIVYLPMNILVLNIMGHDVILFVCQIQVVWLPDVLKSLQEVGRVMPVI